MPTVRVRGEIVFPPTFLVPRVTILDGQHAGRDFPLSGTRVGFYHKDHVVVELDAVQGFATLATRYVHCHCCGTTFRSDKPQDPQRDFGYGTCERCHERVAQSWVEHGFLDKPMTIEDARARLARYA